MARSKLEESLAQALDFASKDMNAPWPYPAPIREMHPMWCCEHARAAHTAFYDEPHHDWQWVCRSCSAPGTGRLHEYDRGRKWRVDFAWPEQRLIVECEGINFSVQGGRHQTGAGFAADLEKYAALELAGWTVLRVGQRQITSGVALSLIEKALRSATESVAAVAAR